MSDFGCLCAGCQRRERARPARDPRLTDEALRGYATARENGGRGDRPTVVAAMAIELIELRARLRGGGR